ncbi:NHLP-related RiPP peptide [Lysobacter silvisoli]|uniref:Putative modified peptide n=1 Tax=Lysobacter silvisoli TaxID=2293254 RepID=A0A371JYV6_9GAMM|nr:NHLP-related RiPP peptide [Lysobacter silvisoli]RDZ26780.1 putative modified peptide [Lysobacter silvisoli]
MGNDNAKGHPPLDPKVADKLLHKLGNDDHFRDLFVQDPAAALGGLGLAPAQTKAALSDTSCMMVTNIAPKEEIQASLSELRTYLTSTDTHTVVHCFEAGSVASSLRSK